MRGDVREGKGRLAQLPSHAVELEIQDRFADGGPLKFAEAQVREASRHLQVGDDIPCADRRVGVVADIRESPLDETTGGRDVARGIALDEGLDAD